MKLNLKQIFNLVWWLIKVIKAIFKAEKADIPSRTKHKEVKDIILPYLKRKRLPFSPEDVDSVINGLIWFLNKFTRKECR